MTEACTHVHMCAVELISPKQPWVRFAFNHLKTHRCQLKDALGPSHIWRHFYYDTEGIQNLSCK